MRRILMVAGDEGVLARKIYGETRTFERTYTTASGMTHPLRYFVGKHPRTES
jgi:hypothetical protein